MSSREAFPEKKKVLGEKKKESQFVKSGAEDAAVGLCLMRRLGTGAIDDYCKLPSRCWDQTQGVGHSKQTFCN